MAQFLAILDGYQIQIISSFDPAIPPKQREWYAEDPLERIAELRTVLLFQPITFFCHPPREEEIAAALQAAGMDVGDDGTVQVGKTMDAARNMAQAYVTLGRLCINTIENLDGFDPATSLETKGSLRQLSDAGMALFPPAMVLPILREIGAVLFRYQ